MTFDDYQEEAVTTAIYRAADKIIYPALALVGEAGEVAEKVSKVLRDNDGIFSDAQNIKIADEMGDVLWTLAALAKDLGWSLDAIATRNLSKLKDRKERGVLQGSGDTR